MQHYATYIVVKNKNKTGEIFKVLLNKRPKKLEKYVWYNPIKKIRDIQTCINVVKGMEGNMTKGQG